MSPETRQQTDLLAFVEKTFSRLRAERDLAYADMATDTAGIPVSDDDLHIINSFDADIEEAKSLIERYGSAAA